MNNDDLARLVMARIDTLARISEDPDRLTRTFGSPAMRKANALVGGWMQEAGMTVSQDVLGNLIGYYPGTNDNAKSFILGSHLDTVRDAGKYDGPLGVIVAIACVQQLHKQKVQLPFALEVIGFSDEEGVRFQSTYLGSKALAGFLKEKDLKRVDSNGVSLSDAIRTFGGDPTQLENAKRDPQKIFGYAEVHIEQGPVLEKNDQPLGVVSAIAGQMRVRVAFTGQAGHAGTTPMNLRRDALAGAAEFILAVEKGAREKTEAVATVGQIDARPGASNVIPGKVTLSLDVRHAADNARHDVCNRLQMVAQQIADKRELTLDWEVVHEARSIPCSRELTATLKKAATGQLMSVTELPSGAGHDAAVMGEITPITMLFVRCKGGISHHPDESVRTEDVGAAISVMSEFLRLLANEKRPFN